MSPPRGMAESPESTNAESDANEPQETSPDRQRSSFQAPLSQSARPSRARRGARIRSPRDLGCRLRQDAPGRSAPGHTRQRRDRLLPGRTPQDYRGDPLAFAVEQASNNGIVVVATAGNTGFQKGKSAPGPRRSGLRPVRDGRRRLGHDRDPDMKDDVVAPIRRAPAETSSARTPTTRRPARPAGAASTQLFHRRQPSGWLPAEPVLLRQRHLRGAAITSERSRSCSKSTRVSRRPGRALPAQRVRNEEREARTEGAGGSR